MKNFKLRNNVTIPCIGYGTYKTPNNSEGYKLILEAIKAGYRHIDTAQNYNNEELVGKAIKESGINRTNFFITTKISNANQGYNQTLESFYQSLEKLDTEYIDLLLIHWPIPIGHDNDWKQLNIETWKAMEKLYIDGKVKAIGVSNFLIHHLENLLLNCKIPPFVNQLEFNMTYQQREIIEFCKKRNIMVESWGTVMRGKAKENDVLQKIAIKYGKDVGQISIRYCLDKNILPLVKTSNMNRMHSNQDVFNFKLDKSDLYLMDAHNTLDSYTFHPDRNYEWQKIISEMSKNNY